MCLNCFAVGQKMELIKKACLELCQGQAQAEVWWVLLSSLRAGDRDEVPGNRDGVPGDRDEVPGGACGAGTTSSIR